MRDEMTPREALPLRWWPLAIILGRRTPAHGWAERHPRATGVLCAAACVATVLLVGAVEAGA